MTIYSDGYDPYEAEPMDRAFQRVTCPRCRTRQPRDPEHPTHPDVHWCTPREDVVQMADFDKAIKALRRKRGTERIAVFPDRTVVRFQRRYLSGPQHGYTFAAVWITATQLWYLTGAPQFDTEIMRHTEFLTLLASPDVTSVQVATEWLVV